MQSTDIDAPAVLYLHGIGRGDPNRSWLEPMQAGLTGLGYPTIPEESIVSPGYSQLLRRQPQGALPDEPTPTGETTHIEFSRFNYERRMARLEALLGELHPGQSLPPPDWAMDRALQLARWQFQQASFYARNRDIRNAILSRVIASLNDVREVVVVAHSLGSVVARDLLMVLPEDLHVRGMVTLGSPLGWQAFGAPRNFNGAFPYDRVSSWVNVWNESDLVSYGRGISARFPMAVDKAVRGGGLGSHFSYSFTCTEPVCLAVGDAYFGSRTKSIALIERSLSSGLEPHELLLAMRLVHGHNLATYAKTAAVARATAAMAVVQEHVLDQLADAYASAGVRLPQILAEARQDSAPPHPLPRISRTDALSSLLLLATSNSFAPYEIAVPDQGRRTALGTLAVAVGQTADYGLRTYDCLSAAQKAMDSSSTGRLVLGALGVAILAAGPIGWALAAPAGLAGGAAIVGGLAAFGPGGMVGGLATLGAITSLGTGTSVAALLSDSVENVETAVVHLLARAIARSRFDLGSNDDVWTALAGMESELALKHFQLGVYCDSDAPSVKDLNAKIRAVRRAMDHMVKEELIDDVQAPPKPASASEIPELLQGEQAPRELESGQETPELA